MVKERLNNTVAKGYTMDQRKAVRNADMVCHGLNKMRAKWNGKWDHSVQLQIHFLT